LEDVFVKLLFSILLFPLILNAQTLAANNQTPSANRQTPSPAHKKLKLVPPDGEVPPPTENPETGDVDMTQFRGLKPAQKGPKLKVNSTCEDADGSLLKRGDRGYKDCIENKANRVMNQPHPPEAVPYEPRTD
jgi:hypothetical protein